MTTIADLFNKFNCMNCQDEINGIRVHCAVCENFDLCLQCFSAGAEIGAHKNNHDYQFMDTGTAILSVFRGKGAWTAREEIHLLDAIEQFGFGNWEDISKHIETKSAEDAKEEYVNKFVHGTIGRHTWTPAQSQRPTLVDHTAEDPGPLGSSALQRLPPLDITNEEAVQLGYMPNRDSFEREYDPTAEQLISTMSLQADDTDADYMLKLAHVDMYTRRTRERVRRKRLVRDYQLVANFFRNRNYSQHPGMTREQREFRDRFRVFAQFYTSNEYERLLASLEREKELRVRLSELCRYRFNGLTKIDECRHFEQHAAMALHRPTGPYGHGKTDSTAPSTGSQRPPASISHLPQPSSKKADLSNGSEANSSSTGPSSTLPTGGPISCAASSPSRNYSDSCRGSSGHTMIPSAAVAGPMGGLVTATTTAGATMPPVPAAAAAATSRTTSLQLQQQPPPLLQPNGNDHNAGAAPRHHAPLHQQPPQQQLASEKLAENNINNNNVDATDLQREQTTPMMSSVLRRQLDELQQLKQPLGQHLLTVNEQQLCKVHNLPPTTYMSLKTLLLSGAPLAMQSLSPLENTLRKYFIKAGWLSH